MIGVPKSQSGMHDTYYRQLTRVHARSVHAELPPERVEPHTLDEMVTRDLLAMEATDESSRWTPEYLAWLERHAPVPT